MKIIRWIKGEVSAGLRTVVIVVFLLFCFCCYCYCVFSAILFLLLLLLLCFFCCAVPASHFLSINAAYSHPSFIPSSTTCLPSAGLCKPEPVFISLPGTAMHVLSPQRVVMSAGGLSGEIEQHVHMRRSSVPLPDTYTCLSSTQHHSHHHAPVFSCM